MGFGNLDRRIEIQVGTETVLTNGERSVIWSEQLTCWAALDYGSGDEDYEADQITASNSIMFKIRYAPGLNEKMRISYSSEVYDILHIAEVDRQRYLILKAKKKD